MRAIFFFVTCTLFAAEDISGFWKSYRDDGKPQCVFGIYQHEDYHYGRIIGTFDDEGVMNDTIEKPIALADGVVGTPHMCGLDIIYYLYDAGKAFNGRIIDPTKGKTYNCSIWRSGENLILRGKVLMFGRNITWYPISMEDFPKGFKLPDLKSFIPSIPQTQ